MKKEFSEGPPPRHLSKFAQIIMTFNYSSVKIGFCKRKESTWWWLLFTIRLSGNTKVIRKILNLWTLSSIFGVRIIIVISMSSVSLTNITKKNLILLCLNYRLIFGSTTFQFVIKKDNYFAVHRLLFCLVMFHLFTYLLYLPTVWWQKWKINFKILKLMNNKVTQLSFGFFFGKLCLDEKEDERLLWWHQRLLIFIFSSNCLPVDLWVDSIL